MSKLSIGIVGAGIGGLCAAIGLLKVGYDVTVFEQTPVFGRIGADINLTPNAVHAIDGLGVGEVLRKTAARPTHRISRMWDTGEETSRIEMSAAAEKKYGAPQLTIHRADLLSALEAKLPSDVFRMGWKGQSIEQNNDLVSIGFEDGEEQQFDLLIGADGIHSMVRAQMFGAEHPEFTGIVSYRATVPREKLEGMEDLDAFTKWWGPESTSQIVVFPLTLGQEIFIFATTPQDDWREESWTLQGDVEELKNAYSNFHPEAQALLAACTHVAKSALYVREPLSNWSQNRVTLLGDAAHPMVPFMAQGACQAIEDAVVLSRALENCAKGQLGDCLRSYETARRDRTAKIQIASRGNKWLKKGGNADWVYGYDAWGIEI